MKKIIWILYLSFLGLMLNAQTSKLPYYEYGTPKTYEVGGITITGVKFLDQDILKTLCGIKVGDAINLPGEEIPRAIETMWRQDLFSDIEIVSTNIVGNVIFLEFRLVELARLSKFKFNGLKKTEVNELRDELNLVAGKKVNANLITTTENKIYNYYRKKGFLLAEVHTRQTDDLAKPNHVILDFDINKGRKVKIDEIVIEGNYALSDRQVKKSMKETKERFKIGGNKPKNILKDAVSKNPVHTLANISVSKVQDYLDEQLGLNIFSTSKYSEDKFDDDKLAILQKYNSNGYRDARIIEDSVYFADSENLIVKLKVEEGRKYYFRDITWVGNSKHESKDLSQILNIRKGDVYNQEMLSNRLSFDPNNGDISSLYMDDGYLFFQVNPIEKRIEGDSIDLEIRISEGPQATINNIIIKGNDKTNEHVIRREIRTVPGQKFRRSDIIRTQRELAGLGYFNPETIGIEPVPNPSNGTVDIIYNLEERPNDQLELSAGWGGSQVVGSLGVTFNNFSIANITKPESWRPLPSGDGQRLSLRIQSTGQRSQALSASFTEPWLGGKKRNEFTIGGGYSRIGSGFTSTTDFTPTSKLTQGNAYVSLGRRIKFPDQDFFGVHSFSFTHYNLFNWGANFIVSDGKFYNFAYKYLLSRNTIDNPLYPRGGSNFEFSIEATPPLSLLNDKDYSTLEAAEKYKNPEYIKPKLKIEWYNQLKGKLVLKAAAKMGWMGYYNSDIGYAPFERYELGGDGLSNNFAQLFGRDIIALRGYDVLTSNQLSNARVGDPFFSKFTLELRYPLTLNPSSTIYALTFLEAGNSWNNFESYNPFNLYRSAGLGLRFFLPMFGLIGFDYGLGFDQKVSGTTNGFGNSLKSYGKFSFMLGFEPE